jgi:hypothetical protein
MLRPASNLPVYTLADGERWFGPEFWMGTFYEELLSTIPTGGILLPVFVTSDATDTCNGNRYPFRCQLACYSLDVRRKDPGSALIGLGPIPHIYRTRGSNTHIHLNDQQKAAKKQLYATAAAQILSGFDELAKEVRTFKMLMPDGSESYVPVHVRLAGYIADYEEKKNVLAMSGGNYSTNACARCMFLKPASDVDSWPYMNMKRRCHLSEKRTVEGVITLQARLQCSMRCNEG